MKHSNRAGGAGLSPNVGRSSSRSCEAAGRAPSRRHSRRGSLVPWPGPPRWWVPWKRDGPSSGQSRLGSDPYRCCALDTPPGPPGDFRTGTVGRSPAGRAALSPREEHRAPSWTGTRVYLGGTMDLDPITVLVLVIIVLVLLGILLEGLFLIQQNQVGILTRKMLGRKMPPGQVIARHGQIGVQASTLVPGCTGGCPSSGACAKASIVEVGQYNVATVESIDGRPLPRGRLLGGRDRV